MNRTDSTPEGTYGTPHSMGPTHSMEPTHSMGPTQGIRNPPVQSLTDTQLVEHADLAVRRAHSSAVALLDAVAEIDRRALYLGAGYSSMYDYCTRRWRYSSATAARYIAAARAADRFPQVRQMLEQRRLTVCGVARLAGVLTPENYDDLLTRSAGKTFAEVEALAGTRKTAPRVPDRIRIIGASQPASKEEESLSLGIEQGPDGVGNGCSSRVANGVAQAEVIGSASEDESRSRDASTNSPSSTPIVANDRIASTLDVESNIQRGCQSRQVPTESELRYEIRFAAKQKFVEKLERAKSVCSNKADLESILKRALDDLLDRRDPERRSKRRMERSSKRRA
ncbi:MAG: hypothetical protein KDA27_24605, partial [Candidatus Eisenbacteria bacterium]|nr:hypothetical protein [Candidatus Eisenbacteria bacterium]